MDTKVENLLGLQSGKVYQQEFKDNAVNYQEFQNLHQENKEIYQGLIKSKDEQIFLLKEENSRLKKELSGKK